MGVGNLYKSCGCFGSRHDFDDPSVASQYIFDHRRKAVVIEAVELKHSARYPPGRIKSNSSSFFILKNHPKQSIDLNHPLDTIVGYLGTHKLIVARTT